MAMAVGATQEGEPMSEINTTPLIDVMLVLLIMLIVTLPPQRHAVKLDTPVPPPPDAPPPDPNLPDPVRIQVDFDGTILWNGRVVDRPTLENELAIESQRAQQPEIHIEPHRLAKYGVVAHVMASAQRLGLTKLGGHGRNLIPPHFLAGLTLSGVLRLAMGAVRAQRKLQKQG